MLFLYFNCSFLSILNLAYTYIYIYKLNLKLIKSYNWNTKKALNKKPAKNTTLKIQGGKYAKFLAKIKFSAIFHIRDIQFGEMIYQNL